ncbi:MAG: FixH family protein [Pseudomonadota bacterium]
MEITPWYRQFWPWFLFGLPGCVVIAGLATWWIAAHNADSVVVDDYYKEGLAINRELDKQRRADDLRLRAAVNYQDQALDVVLDGDIIPVALTLRLSHPMDANFDQSLQLAQINPGHYRTPMSLQGSTRWHWQIEPLYGPEREADWRLDGELLVSPDDVQ